VAGAQVIDDVDPRRFRDALGHFATGVTLVTAPGGDSLVVSSLMSVSLAPPLVAFGAGRSSLTWRRMRRSSLLAVNVLPETTKDVRDRARPGADRLAGLEIVLGADRLPRLAGAIAVLDCAPVAEHPAGDHTIVVCRVLDVTLNSSRAPLVVFGGALGTFRP
jgi:3-hydroxy-9,10-secoandrosta-1,3,5(10)-triene-9,17-dione monooxygenase reductase component